MQPIFEKVEPRKEVLVFAEAIEEKLQEQDLANRSWVGMTERSILEMLKGVGEVDTHLTQGNLNLARETLIELGVVTAMALNDVETQLCQSQ